MSQLLGQRKNREIGNLFEFLPEMFVKMRLFERFSTTAGKNGFLYFAAAVVICRH